MTKFSEKTLTYINSLGSQKKSQSYQKTAIARPSYLSNSIGAHSMTKFSEKTLTYINSLGSRKKSQSYQKRAIARNSPTFLLPKYIDQTEKEYAMELLWITSQMANREVNKLSLTNSHCKKHVLLRTCKRYVKLFNR